MGERYMRMLLFFDLPVVTAADRKEYTKFRKFLIKDGFIMVQESVYSKLTLNGTVTQAQRERIIKNKPPRGIVQILIVTEKQYASMEYVIGQNKHIEMDNTNRLVIL